MVFGRRESFGGDRISAIPPFVVGPRGWKANRKRLERPRTSIPFNRSVPMGSILHTPWNILAMGVTQRYGRMASCFPIETDLAFFWPT